MAMALGGCGSTAPAPATAEGRWASGCSNKEPARQWTAELKGGHLSATETVYLGAECSEAMKRLTRTVEGDYQIANWRNTNGGRIGEMNLKITRTTVTPLTWDSLFEFRILYHFRAPRPSFTHSKPTTIVATAAEAEKTHYGTVQIDADGGMRFPLPEFGKHGTPRLRLAADPKKVPTLYRR